MMYLFSHSLFLCPFLSGVLIRFPRDFSRSYSCVQIIFYTFQYSSQYTHDSMRDKRVCWQNLEKISKWGVNIFQIAKASNNRPLTAVVFTILQVPVKSNDSIYSIVISWPATRCNDPRCSSVCLPHAIISETKRDRPVVTMKRK